MNNVSVAPNSVSTSRSAVLRSISAIIPATALSLCVMPLTSIESKIIEPIKPQANIAHTLAETRQATTINKSMSYKNLINQELNKLINVMIDQMVDPEPELDQLTIENLWELYDYGFPNG